MTINRTCKICGNLFEAIKVTQFFCSRKCFKKDYYVRTKGRIQDLQQNPVYPMKECGFCLKKSSLGFDPIDNKKMFDSWGCPFCGATNSLIWENQGNPNSYQIISQILVSIQLVSQSMIQQTVQRYHTYNLPVNRLEKGNPSYVVMSCDSLDITEIQKKNRKKILFS